MCSPEKLRRAANWGLAMRLGQRLSGGVAACLKRSRLGRDGDTLRLEVGKRDAALLGETVERRLKTLAAEMGLRPETDGRASRRRNGRRGSGRRGGC